MKGLACLLFTSGIGVLGFEEAKKLSARVRRLSVLRLDALRMEKDMEWEAPTAVALFRRLKSPAFQHAAHRMECGYTPEEAMQEATNQFSQEEKEALLDYVAMLGVQNPTAQVHGAKILAERLKRMEEEAREKEKRLGKVYCLGGILIGLLISLLLL